MMRAEGSEVDVDLFQNWLD